MKVSELINELKKCDQDAKVIIDISRFDFSIYEFDVLTDAANKGYVYLVNDLPFPEVEHE